MADKDGVTRRGDDTPDATRRAGGGAAGGIDPRPGDPDTPAAARRRQAGDAADHARAGFGDDKGGNWGGDAA